MGSKVTKIVIGALAIAVVVLSILYLTSYSKIERVDAMQERIAGIDELCGNLAQPTFEDLNNCIAEYDKTH